MIEINTPQPYPLGCIVKDMPGIRHLVIGWAADGRPIVVRDSPSPRTGGEGYTGSPYPLTGQCRYYLPETNVSMSGEVSAIVDGSVDATVRSPDSKNSVYVVQD